MKMVDDKSQSKRRESSLIANKQRALLGSTVHLPDLSEQDRKRRAELEADSEAWIWEMCGPKSGIEVPLTRKFTSQQSEMIGDYTAILRDGGDELFLASRGEGKTTYLRAMIWKSISEGSVSFAGFVSATGDDAASSRETIQDMITRSKPFARLYPEIALPCTRAHVSSQLAKSMRASGRRFDDPSVVFDSEPIQFEWSQKGMRLPAVPGSPSYRAMIQFRGADKAIRGLNKFGRRPQVICIDDLDTPDTVNNLELTKKVVDRVNLDIGGLGSPTKPVARIFLATLPKQGIGVAHHFAKQGHPFRVRRFQYLIEKPVEWEMWMEYVNRRQKAKANGDQHARDSHQFYLDNREKMDNGAVVSNEWRFNAAVLPDGSQVQVSALQNYFDEWADKGEFYCRCELDNEIIESDKLIISSLEQGHVMNAQGDLGRLEIEPTTTIITRGIDVRKMELHFVDVACDELAHNRIINYDNRAHGGLEITVEQAETAILEGLRKIARQSSENEPFFDRDGSHRQPDLTLIDKGWFGSWREDGETKTWASQPVDTFCMEHGLRRFLPAKGQPAYRSPKPSPEVIIGDNWHINRGEGPDRKCHEVIWNASHWHQLVEGLFLLPDEDPDRWVLFIGAEGMWKGHKRFADHIHEGAQDLAEMKRRGSATRKQRYRRDHWWDSAAMALVAKSIEQWFRANLESFSPRPRSVSVNRRRNELEIGAR